MISLADLANLSTAIGILIGAVSIFIGMLMYKKQVNTQIFLEYTKRYDQLMEDWDESLRDSRLNMWDEDPPESYEIRRQALRYLNLCSEEYYLCHENLLYRKTWNIWEDELIKTMRSPLFK